MLQTLFNSWWRGDSLPIATAEIYNIYTPNKVCLWAHKWSTCIRRQWCKTIPMLGKEGNLTLLKKIQVLSTKQIWWDTGRCMETSWTTLSTPLAVCFRSSNLSYPFQEDEVDSLASRIAAVSSELIWSEGCRFDNKTWNPRAQGEFWNLRRGKNSQTSENLPNHWLHCLTLIYTSQHVSHMKMIKFQ